MRFSGVFGHPSSGLQASEIVPPGQGTRRERFPIRHGGCTIRRIEREADGSAKPLLQPADRRERKELVGFCCGTVLAIERARPFVALSLQALGRKTSLANFIQKCAIADLEYFRGLPAVPVVILQDLQNQIAL